MSLHRVLRCLTVITLMFQTCVWSTSLRIIQGARPPNPLEIRSKMKTRTYETVPGFFAQDAPNPVGIPAIPPRFGLLDDSDKRWDNFFAHVKDLNHKADKHTSYKVFFLGRHGEGFHNVAEAKYGTPAWNDFWSKLDGDGEITWGPDAELTTTGEGQAVEAGDAWRTEFRAGLPHPGKFYSSPLTRALKTCEITFEDIFDHNTKPTVLENCREVYGVHTCDMRRSRTYIETTFPKFKIERNLTEEDELWEPDVRETDAHVAERAKEVLDLVFNDDKETFISITGHGGIINGFLTSVGRPAYSLPTGGVLPVVVKSVVSH